MPYGDLPPPSFDVPALPAGRRSYAEHAHALRAEALRDLVRRIGHRLRRGLG